MLKTIRMPTTIQNTPTTPAARLAQTDQSAHRLAKQPKEPKKQDRAQALVRNKKKMREICASTGDFPFLLLCGLTFLSFGFFGHHSSLKLLFMPFFLLNFVRHKTNFRLDRSPAERNHTRNLLFFSSQKHDANYLSSPRL
jgi:hypothetical protein